MAEHNLFKAQADIAYNAALPFLTSEGWNVIKDENGFITSLHPTDNVPVLKVEGYIAKEPRFIPVYMQSNALRVREQHFSMHGGFEMIKEFEDKSHLAKDIINVPGLGAVTQYRYYLFRIGEDGSLNIISTSVNTPEYPYDTVNMVFFMVNAVPKEWGSHVSIIMQSNSTLPINDESRRAAVDAIDYFYRSVLSDISAAPIE